MQEFVKKLIERLEERSKEYNAGVRLHGKPEEMLTYEAIEIINQLAEEYGDGWIPCEKEIPKDGVVVDLSCEYMGTPYETVGYFKNGNRGHSYIVDNDVFMRSAVLAWRPRPIPYQPSNSKNSNNWKQQTMSRFERME